VEKGWVGIGPFAWVRRSGKRAPQQYLFGALVFCHFLFTIEQWEVALNRALFDTVGCPFRLVVVVLGWSGVVVV